MAYEGLQVKFTQRRREKYPQEDDGIVEIIGLRMEDEGENGEETSSESDSPKIPLVETGGVDEKGVVREYEDVLEIIGFGLFHMLILIVNGIAVSSDAIEVLSISFVLRIIRRGDEFGVTDVQNALLSSILFAGMLFGSYIWGSFADVSGRRFTLLTSLTINGVFGLLSAFAPNFCTFVLFRFISGVG